MGRNSPPPDASHAELDHDHLLQFYETDAFLVRSVADFMVPPLSEGHAGIIVATPEHREGFEAAITAAGISVEELTASGRLQLFDAAELLQTFMVDGGPDPERFTAVVSEVIDRAAAGGREVFVYGEMVALLWADGDVRSTIALEDIWNDFAAVREFKLLCAYPSSGFDEGSRAEFRRICEQHSEVGPNEGPTIGSDGQGLLIAELQEQTAALRADVARLRREQNDLVELAYVDPLTGLANRRAFDDHLEREWALTLRDGIDSFVVVADLDRLKQVNDNHGHAAGDETLCRFADALRSSARSTDILARIGGDEFAALLIRCNEHFAHGFGVRLRKALRDHSRPEYGEPSVSIGYASLLHSSSAAKALDRADLAMLARKRSDNRLR